jgi:hypothetical protein
MSNYIEVDNRVIRFKNVDALYKTKDTYKGKTTFGVSFVTSRSRNGTATAFFNIYGLGESESLRIISAYKEYLEDQSE